MHATIASEESTDPFTCPTLDPCAELYAQCLRRLYESSPPHEVGRLLVAIFIWGVDIFAVAIAVACAVWLVKFCWTMLYLLQRWTSSSLTRAVLMEAIAGLFVLVLPDAHDESNSDGGDADGANTSRSALDQHAIDAAISQFAALEVAPTAPTPQPRAGAGDRWLARPPRCVVCWEDPVTHVCSPCGHACLCPKDARLWRSRLRGRCPMCKAHMQDCFRFFLP